MNFFVRRLLRRVILTLLAIAVAWIMAKRGLLTKTPQGPAPTPTTTSQRPASIPTASPTRTSGDEAILAAFKARTSDIVFSSRGLIKKVLPDDNDGARHQKFILMLANGHSLLVAHNLDLAPRIPIREGDSIDFKGEYEWSEQGGVLHWTHRDPGHRHEDGWITFEGKTYQ